MKSKRDLFIIGGIGFLAGSLLWGIVSGALGGAFQLTLVNSILLFATSGLVGLICMTIFNSGIGQGRSREYQSAKQPVPKRPTSMERRTAYEEWRRF